MDGSLTRPHPCTPCVNYSRSLEGERDGGTIALTGEHFATSSRILTLQATWSSGQEQWDVD